MEQAQAHAVPTCAIRSRAPVLPTYTWEAERKHAVPVCEQVV